MDQLYREIGIFDILDSNKKFKIPEGINHIKIDVGLSADAPNTAMWLREKKDRFVFGIEPLEDHWEQLNKLNFGDRFLGVKGAIANVPSPIKQTFYHLENSGASSLLKPTEGNGNKIKREEQVNTFSLAFLLDHIPWDRFKYIEHIKTDTEGYDYETVKSLGNYIGRVASISSEISINNVGEYEHVSVDKYNRFMHYLSAEDFSADYRYLYPCGCGNPKCPPRFSNQELKFINNKFFSSFFPKLDNKTVGL